MWKFVLKRLLEKYELARAEHPELEEPEDARIQHLREFLLTDNMLLKDKHAEISFKEFARYLSKTPLFKDSYFTLL